jgi:hypothetical protein
LATILMLAARELASVTLLIRAALQSRTVIGIGLLAAIARGSRPQFTVTGWQSCWLGMFRVTVAHNLTLTGNITADPDGNEVAHNTVGGNLSCSGNVPANQIGDSAGGPSTILGNVAGQCSGLVK